MPHGPRRPPAAVHTLRVDNMRATILATAFCLAAFYPASGNEFPLTAIRVVDGDTINATIHLSPFDLAITSAPIRCLGYDAPEISRRRRTVRVDDDEIRRGRQAAAYLAELLKRGQAVARPGEETKRVRGPYGRYLLRIFVDLADGDRIDVAEEMKRRNHTR